MSRGRKKIGFNMLLDEKSLSKQSVGIYFEYILRHLYSQNPITNKSAENLFEKIEKEKKLLIDNTKLRPNSSTPREDLIAMRFEIPHNWKWHLLSDFVFYQEGPGIRSFQYKSSGIKLLNVQNITQDKLKLELTERHVSPEEYKKKYQHFTIEEGDILFASSGGSWGKFCWFENPGYKVMLNTSTIRLRTYSENGLLNKFLYMFLRTPFFRKQLTHQLMGMQPNFGSTHLNSVSIPIPPIEEQQLIMKFIDSLGSYTKSKKAIFNSKIEDEVSKIQSSQINNNFLLNEFNEQIILLTKFRQSILQEAVLGKLTKNNKAKFYPLGEIIEFTKNGFSGKPNDAGRGVKRLGIESVTQNQFININENMAKYIEISKERKQNYLVKKNDILICRQNGNLNFVGKAAVFVGNENEIIFSDSLIQIRPNSQIIDSSYLCLFLNSKIARLQLDNFCSTTAGNFSINGINLKKVTIPVYEISDQKKIISKIEKMMRLCDDLEKQINQSRHQVEQLIQSVLREAFEQKPLKKQKAKGFLN